MPSKNSEWVSEWVTSIKLKETQGLYRVTQILRNIWKEKSEPSSKNRLKVTQVLRNKKTSELLNFQET